MVFGCHHNAYKAYHQVHHTACAGGGDIIGSVFNINYNCSGGHTNFWGGLGMGLGMGLGNWFGGFGMGGFGFGNFGFGGGWGSPFAMSWGGGGGGSNWNTTSKSSSHLDSDYVSTKAKDIDNPKIADFTERINSLKKGDKETYDKLVKDIEKAKEDTDKLNKEADLKTYDELLKLAKDKYENGTTTTSTVTTGGGAVNGNTPGTVTNGIVKIGGVEIKTLDNLKTVPFGNLKDITPEQAKIILKTLGFINNDTDTKAKKMSNVPHVLFLMEKAGLSVSCAKNTKSGLSDPMIEGKISNVTYIDGVLRFNIDNNTDGYTSLFGYKYSFKGSVDTNNSTATSINVVKIDATKGKKGGYVLNGFNQYEYTFKDNGLFERNGEALVSQYNNGVRTQIGPNIDKKVIDTDNTQ